VAYPSRDSKLEIFPLRKDPLVLICHPHHPFAKSKSLKLKSLSGQKFIGFEPDIRPAKPWTASSKNTPFMCST